MGRWVLAVSFLLASLQAQQLTSVPHGPFHVDRGRLIDANGRVFLIRGTELPEFRLSTVAEHSQSGDDFGAYSATSLSAIRLRFNMNAVRLPVQKGAEDSPELARVARLANELELLVVVPGEVPAALRGMANVVSEDGIEVARDWAPRFDDPAACAKLPADPAVVTRMVEDKLAYFDAHEISWFVSTYEPGKLVDDLFLQNGTSPEAGWTCGEPEKAGVGRIIQAYLRRAEYRGLYVVSASGGLDLPRGGFGIAYGPAMGAVSVDVTDSAGVTRPAFMRFSSSGWGQINFVVPRESATGVARMTVKRADGTRIAANIRVADTAPGFWTGVSCAGPAAGISAGRTISECDGWRCRALPVASSRVRLMGSGFRNAAASEIDVRIGGVKARIVSYGAAGPAGIDQLTIEVPASVAGAGETDVICRVRGRIANVVRMRV
jgi:hypothetical protein